MRQVIVAIAATVGIAIGCGANPDDQDPTHDEDISSIPSYVITGTGQCRASVLTASATPTAITNATDTGISPTITAKFPLELTTLSGDATAFTAKVGVTAANAYSCSYIAAGPSRMVLSTCSGTQDVSYTFSASSLTLTRITAGVGTISLQATLNPADDQKRCTADACDPSAGVSHTNQPTGYSCSINNNVCDGVESCDGAGNCLAGTAAPSGTSCSDGQLCNGEETCNGSGTCSPGTPPPTGTSCSDGNYCNGEEYCVSGVCQAGTAPPAANFDDGDPCTTDSCDVTKGGIVNAPISGCTSNAGAPAFDPTQSTQFATSTQFLYSGSSPVQTGVSSGTIVATRAAVLRGRVLQNDGVTPISTTAPATVTVVGHPEYGQTLTRAGGWYDLAVNGGQVYAVDINAPGVLRVQRQAKPLTLSYFIVPDVVVTPPYPSTDVFVPGSSTSHVVRGQTTPVGTDADGARRALLYFPPETRLTNYTVADGTQMAVDVTEYTTTHGPSRMPGTLPSSSGYTYAVNVTFPAAAAAGVVDVHFDHNVSLYTENFTGYPVGTPVPLGYYDRTNAVWSGESSGRIIKLITTPAGGQATIDIDGDGTAESPTALDTFGILADERTMLAAQYSAGATLWRSSVPHFSDWDANWGYTAPPGAAPPPANPPDPDDPDDPCTRKSSVIGCESRTLGESLPIYGTPFTLNYQSERAQGFRSRIRIPITDGTVLPSTIIAARIDIEAAGRAYHFQRTAPLAANDAFTWVWDGTDAYGRLIQHGVVNAKVTVSFDYNGTTTLSTPTFGGTTDVTISGNRAARIFTYSRTQYLELRRSEALPLGFGGWTVSVNHNLESLEALYFGDGTRRDLTEKEQMALNYVVNTIAGGGSYPNYNDGSAAVGAYLGSIGDIASAPDSTLYIAQDGYTSSMGRLRKVSTAGTITTIAGQTPVVARSPSSDGSTALNAAVFPTNLGLLPDGSVLFAESNNNQLWKITNEATPKLRLVAGTGATGAGNACDSNACGDGGPATAALLSGITDIKVLGDGSILIADSNHSRIRRIGPEGTITTFWYTGSDYVYPEQMALRPDGSMLVKLYGDIFVDVTSAGGGSSSLTYLNNPDGTRMTANSTWCQYSATFSGTYFYQADGSLLISCSYGVMVGTTSGTYTQIAGSPSQATGSSGDGGFALRALFQQANPMVVDPVGNVLLADIYSGRVRQLSPPTAKTAAVNVRIPAEDGSEIYTFSPTGQHVSTTSTLHGAARYSFTYDPTSHKLNTITDEGGNATQITRSGSAVTIKAPHGQTTTINLDANGYASSVVNPVTSEITHVAHSSTGLLTDLTDANGHLHHFDYEAADGRLLRDTDATPGSVGTRLATTSTNTGYTVEITSPEGRVTRHDVNRYMDFGSRTTIERRKITNGVGLVTQADYTPDGATTVTAPNGVITSVQNMSVDAQWGILASFPSLVTTQNGTKTMSRQETRTAGFSTPTDPTTMTGETVTTLLSGTSVPNETTTSVYTSGSPSTWLTTTAAGRQVRTSLDSLDRVTKFEILGSSPVTLNPVQYAYDSLGRMWQVTVGSRVYQTNFDSTTGWVDSTTIPLSLGTTFNTRDTDGRPKTMTLAGSRALAMGYDLAGNVTSVTPPAKPAHDFGFDPNNLLASYLPPDGTPSVNPRNTTYTRDKDNLLTLASNPLEPVTYSYDLLGRLVQRSDAATTINTYDSSGRLATVSSGGVLITNTWDGTMRTAQKTTGPFTKTVNKAYDNFFRIASWDIDGTNSIALTYDNDNIVTGAGAMTVTTSPNGLLTGTSLGSVSDSWGYDAYGAVASHTITGSATAFSWSTTRDAAGRLGTKTEVIGGVTHTYLYGYDAAGRLTSVKVDGAPSPTRSWTYDGNTTTGNGNRDGGTYDNQDRLTALGSTTYTYTNNGDLASKTVSGTTTTYSYDANGNLRNVSGGITYTIDGQNRRVGKTKGGVLQGFVYEGSRIVAELDHTGAELSRFVYATGGHSPDYMIRGGITYRIVKDHLGSPRLIVNTSNGSVAERIDYDEWGVATVALGELSPPFQPFGYAGGLWDRDTNLVRFGARDYDAAAGRWVSKDPLRFGAGPNLYCYVSNDPVNISDVDGMDPSGGGLSGGGGSSDSWGPPAKLPCDDPSPQKQCPYKTSEFKGNPDRTLCHYECSDGLKCTKEHMGYITCPTWGECGEKPNGASN